MSAELSEKDLFNITGGMKEVREKQGCWLDQNE